MATARAVLQQQFNDSSTKLATVVADLDDDEFFWEPVPGCWTVHDRREKRAASADGCGRWVIDYEVPEPSPAPLTTIAWRTVHVAAVNYLYWDYAFGPATASFDLEMPGNAQSARDWLEHSQRPLADTLANFDDAAAALDDLALHNSGERWPIARIFTTLIVEQVHHGAEISLLRDLYRNRTAITNAGRRVTGSPLQDSS